MKALNSFLITQNKWAWMWVCKVRKLHQAQHKYVGCFLSSVVLHLQCSVTA